MKKKKSLQRDVEKATVNTDVTAKVNNLSFALQPTTTTTINRPQVISDISQGPTIMDLGPTVYTPIGQTAAEIGLPNIKDIMQGQQAELEAARAAAEVKKREKYDYLMSKGFEALTGEGYFVLDASVFKGDPNTKSGSIFLALMDIQNIENERGTPGALLMHLKEPAAAKDTAGYVGGSSGTFSGQPPSVPPIPEVDSLPPVEKAPDGTTQFEGGVTPIIPEVTSTQQSSMLSMSGKYWWIWYAIAAVAIILIIKFRK